ncbi:hypothetical protein GCM10017557_09570 [Streptomyces aurantiacus]|uniref:Uncharacterized protein n=1 Tax=Streptomyces aurantiacus TaxID=47760 RepID=A0A7G1NS81_9ACTN|nr:hypothetical protein GCM10017557_09570 [Streptomyces aurantiacus]
MKHYGHVEKVRLLVVDDDPPLAGLVATVARYEAAELDGHAVLDRPRPSRTRQVTG